MHIARLQTYNSFLDFSEILYKKLVIRCDPKDISKSDNLIFKKLHVNIFNV